MAKIIHLLLSGATATGARRNPFMFNTGDAFGGGNWNKSGQGTGTGGSINRWYGKSSGGGCGHGHGGANGSGQSTTLGNGGSPKWPR